MNCVMNHVLSPIDGGCARPTRVSSCLHFCGGGVAPFLPCFVFFRMKVFCLIAARLLGCAQHHEAELSLIHHNIILRREVCVWGETPH